MIIDTPLVTQLIATQFPKWARLPLLPVAKSGWDNRTFRLGDQLLVRLPSDAKYVNAIINEQIWLPWLAPLLPLPISTVVEAGKPSKIYPWDWAIYQWIEGDTVAATDGINLVRLAEQLTHFLHALECIDARGGPPAGANNFYRGGDLSHYDGETRKAIAVLGRRIDQKAALDVWEKGLASRWQKMAIWVHGDLSAGNLLVKDGQLHAVIDFGQLAIDLNFGVFRPLD